MLPKQNKCNYIYNLTEYNTRNSSNKVFTSLLLLWFNGLYLPT